MGWPKPPQFLARAVSQSVPGSAGLPDGRANPCCHGMESTEGSWGTDLSSTDPIPARPRGRRDHSLGGQQHWDGTLKSHHIPKASNGHEVGLATHCTAPELQALEQLWSRCHLSGRAQAGDRQDAAPGFTLLLQRSLWGCWCWGETQPRHLRTPQMC